MKNYRKNIGFATCLKDRRLQLGISQQELAESIGTSKNTISSIERFEYYPSLILAFKIAQYFDCLVEEVFMVWDNESEVDE